MTTVDDAFPSRYLKADDLQNQHVKFKIKEVLFEEVGQTKEVKPITYFVDSKKGLVLNKTNAKRIEQMHGKQMENWTNKEIQLYPELVQYQGSEVMAIRVLVVVPEPEKVAPPRPKQEDFDDPIDI